MKDYDFEKFLVEIVGADLEELKDSVDQSIANEISKRPKIKLIDDLYYIKNSYDYIKKTPIHFLNPKLPDDKFNEKIASYEILNKLKSNKNINKTILDNDVEKFLTENDYIEYENFKLTEDGEKYFKSIEWIGCYQIFLDSFDFYEFEDYLKNSNEKFMPTALRFLDDHFNLALKRNDFKALFDVQSSKAIYYVLNNDFKKAMAEELKLFIVRLNPNYEGQKLLFHEGINQVNILNLNSLIVALKISDIEAMFKSAWKSLNYKKSYFNKEESFDILIKSMTVTDLDKINRKVESAYFND